MLINTHVKFYNRTVHKNHWETNERTKLLILTIALGDRNYRPIFPDEETEVREKFPSFPPSSLLTCFLSVSVSPLPTPHSPFFLSFLFLFLTVNRYLPSTSDVPGTVLRAGS